MINIDSPAFTIRLLNLRFFSRIGMFEQERKVGNEFIVDCTLVTDATGFRTESLDTTISYADVYEIIAEIMKTEWQLLESVAVEIAARCKSRWQVLRNVSVKITKLTPPIPAFEGECSVEYQI